MSRFPKRLVGRKVVLMPVKLDTWRGPTFVPLGVKAAAPDAEPEEGWYARCKAVAELVFALGPSVLARPVVILVGALAKRAPRGPAPSGGPKAPQLLEPPEDQ